jgi:dienelactone hydrolase
MNFATHAFGVVLIAGVGCSAPQTSFGQDQIDIVQFESLSFPGALFTPFLPAPGEGKPVTVLGILRMPSDADRVPAVILAPGCGGVTVAMHDWARSLKELGIATFVVNSFSGRDIVQICNGQHQINMASVLTDVYRALNILAANPRVDVSRIALMGFSFGGRTALWASHPRFQ